MKNIIKRVSCTLSGTCEHRACEIVNNCHTGDLHKLRDQLVVAETLTREVKKDLAEVRKLLKEARGHRYDE